MSKVRGKDVCLCCFFLSDSRYLCKLFCRCIRKKHDHSFLQIQSIFNRHEVIWPVMSINWLLFWPSKEFKGSVSLYIICTTTESLRLFIKTQEGFEATYWSHKQILIRVILIGCLKKVYLGMWDRVGALCFTINILWLLIVFVILNVPDILLSLGHFLGLNSQVVLFWNKDCLWWIVEWLGSYQLIILRYCRYKIHADRGKNTSQQLT